jgi:hypothetical protein
VLDDQYSSRLVCIKTIYSQMRNITCDDDNRTFLLLLLFTFNRKTAKCAIYPDSILKVHVRAKIQPMINASEIG